jgi:hypothetical protein
VFEHGGRLYPVEGKSRITYSLSWLDPARRWRTLTGEAAANPILIYRGDEGHRGAGYEVLGWRDVGLA